jgi:hypothetical protein
MSEIAKVAGTSVTYIEAHYGYIDDQMLKSAAMQNDLAKVGFSVLLKR